MPRSVRLAALAIASSLISGPAFGATALRLDQAPGTDDVVLTWASDPASPGPYQLLRRELSFMERPSDVLPLNPATDVYRAGLRGPRVALASEAAPTGAEGTTVFQLVDAAGGCSNAAYVLRLAPARTHWADPDIWQYPTLVVDFPPWPGMPDARSLLAHWPTLQRAWRQPGGCPLVELERLPGGALRGANFPLAGATVGLVFEQGAAVSLVLTGASDPADPMLPRPAWGGPPCEPDGGDLAPAPGAQWRLLTELACGVEGVDWFDVNLDDVPDQCPAGLWDPAGSLTVETYIAIGGPPWIEWLPLAVSVSSLGGRPRFSGLPPGRLQPGHGTFAVASGGGVRRAILGRDAGAAPACRCPDADGDGRDDCTEALEGTDPADPTSAGPDADRDGVPDANDICPLDFDPSQADADADRTGNACDPCPGDAANACVDPDGDGLPLGSDNCVDVANPDQANQDWDRWGDACDPCPGLVDDQSDADADGIGDACDCAPDDPASSVPPEVTGLRLAWADPRRTEMALAWDDTRSGVVVTVFEVAGGAIAELHADAGYARAACQASQLAVPSASLSRPTSDSWYLVRSTGACGNGTYGDARTAGADPRDALDARPPCP